MVLASTAAWARYGTRALEWSGAIIGTNTMRVRNMRQTFALVALVGLLGCQPPTTPPVPVETRAVAPSSPVQPPPARAGETQADILTPGGVPIGVPYGTVRWLKMDSIEAVNVLFDRLTAGFSDEFVSGRSNDNVGTLRVVARRGRDGSAVLRERTCQFATITINRPTTEIRIIKMYWPARRGEAVCEGGMDG